ncbi:MAG: hypothetical protein WCA35_25830 [Kovacikia sp.]
MQELRRAADVWVEEASERSESTFSSDNANPFSAQKTSEPKEIPLALVSVWAGRCGNGFGNSGGAFCRYLVKYTIDAAEAQP